MNICSPLGWWIVRPPSTRVPSALAGIMTFLIRTFAKVPRVMTRSFPRRLP
jgi:hypothetical protein